jgi:hypothetical protein
VIELLKNVRADETADALIAASLDLTRKIDKIAVMVEARCHGTSIAYSTNSDLS